MDSYRPTHSTSTSSRGAVCTSLLVGESSALLECPSPKGNTSDFAPELFIRLCEPDSNPASDPNTLVTAWILGLLSIHPGSPWFPFLDLLLDLAIFYLIQAVQFMTGVALLHALYPSELDYAMTAARSMRIGAAGATMFVGIVALRSLLQLGCREPEEDTPEPWDSVWDAVGCLQAKRAPDVRYVAFIGISGSVAFGRRTYDMNGLLHAATAALVGYAVLSVSKGAISYARRPKVSL